jgi:hypothetical protein
MHSTRDFKARVWIMSFLILTISQLIPMANSYAK